MKWWVVALAIGIILMLCFWRKKDTTKACACNGQPAMEKTVVAVAPAKATVLSSVVPSNNVVTPNDTVQVFTGALAAYN
jgi:hypothetical protein